MLQYYPKDYIVYRPYLQNGGHVRLQGTVSKSAMGGPYCNIQVIVDPQHNPLLRPPDAQDLPSPASSASDMTASPASNMTELNSDAGSASQTDEDYESGSEDDSLQLDDSISGLSEHGRTLVPEEASTRASALPYSTSASQPGAHFGTPNPGQLSKQQVLEVKQYCGGRYGSMKGRGMVADSPVGARVMVQCKVAMGATSGEAQSVSPFRRPQMKV